MIYQTFFGRVPPPEYPCLIRSNDEGMEFQQSVAPRMFREFCGWARYETIITYRLTEFFLVAQIGTFVANLNTISAIPLTVYTRAWITHPESLNSEPVYRCEQANLRRTDVNFVLQNIKPLAIFLLHRLARELSHCLPLTTTTQLPVILHRREQLVEGGWRITQKELQKCRAPLLSEMSTSRRTNVPSDLFISIIKKAM